MFGHNVPRVIDIGKGCTKKSIVGDNEVFQRGI